MIKKITFRHYTILLLTGLFLVGCSQGLQTMGTGSAQIKLSEENQGTIKILGTAKGNATITKFLFMTFGDIHRYGPTSLGIRGIVEREALHKALEGFTGADGLVTPKIITTSNNYLIYSKYTSTVEAKAVKIINDANNKASSFTNLWTFN